LREGFHECQISEQKSPNRNFLVPSAWTIGKPYYRRILRVPGKVIIWKFHEGDSVS
jgi:hypothetical protein